MSVTTRARTVDRVAGLAGEHLIFLSEVRERAHIAMTSVTEKDPLARARIEMQVMHDTCEALIDDALVADEAASKHLSVGDDEITRVLDEVAKNNSTDRASLLAMVHDQGIDEHAYREFLRAQILEGKLLQSGRVT